MKRRRLLTTCLGVLSVLANIDAVQIAGRARRFVVGIDALGLVPLVGHGVDRPLHPGVVDEVDLRVRQAVMSPVTADEVRCRGRRGRGYEHAGHYTGTEKIYMNNATVTNATQARKSTCQEEGHALGLDHQYTNTTCMEQGDAVANHISPYPNAHDFAQLQALYAHAN